MSCPDTKAMQEYLEGTANAQDSEAIEDHLEGCLECREVVLAVATPSAEPTDAYAQTLSDRFVDGVLAAGTTVGRYVVARRIGEGGMGVVFSAYDPELDRKVAIKLMRSAPAADESAAQEQRARLVREAHAMARITHPNVIGVYDVGRHGDHVFIAMELIEGETLSRWLARAPRGPAEIVPVFVRAGRGLVAAHAAGLVHRDFKPNNVMIDHDGRVRVVDFGLACSVGGDEGGSWPWPSPSSSSPLDQSLTVSGALLGTPAYMAPEQPARGVTDAVADQFSFCVALYEALCGTRPFVAEDPERLRTAILEGGLQPPVRRVPGWLLRVVSRGLRPRAAERWPSMGELLTALEHDPARARRRWLLAGGVLVALAGAVIGERVLVRRESRMCRADGQLAGVWDATRKQAVQAALMATGKPYAGMTFTAVARALDAYAHAWTAMSTESCEATRVRGTQSEDALELRSECLPARREELRAQVDVLARADGKIAETAVHAASSLGGLDECADVALLRQPVRPPKDAPARARVEAVRQRIDAAQARRAAGQHPAGLGVATSAAQETAALDYRPVEAEALATLSGLQEKNGQYKEAERTLIRAVAAAIAGHDDSRTARALTSLIFIVGTDQVRPADADGWDLLADAAVQRAPTEQNRNALLAARATLRWAEDKVEETAALERQVLALREKLLGPDHPDVADSLPDVCSAIANLGRYDEALPVCQRALALDEKLYGPDHPQMAVALDAAGSVLFNLGRYDEALADQRRALAIREKALPPDHPEIAYSMDEIGNGLRQMGRLDEALAYFRRALASREKTLGPTHVRTANSLSNIAFVLNLLGRYDEAIALQRRALANREAALGPTSHLVADSVNGLAWSLAYAGRHGEALEQFRRALAILEKVVGPQHPSLIIPLDGMGQTLLRMHTPEPAVAPLERALALGENGRASPEDQSSTRFALARALWDSGRDRARARKLVLAARAVYATAGQGSKTQLREVEDWLAEHH